MCVETRQVGTGIYADRALHAAGEALERATSTKGVPGMSVGPGMIGDVLSMSLDVRRMGNDMQAMVEMNRCATPALKRFETNLIAYSQGKAGIVAPPQAQPAAETGAAQGPFVDANYTALLEALIGEQAQAWALNKFIPGSVTQVWVQGRDASGRPAMISANYSFRGMIGGGKGSVRLDFANGEPECMYYADFPTTCKKASRRIVNAYLEGAYR